MSAVIWKIWILMVLLFIKRGYCQDYINHDPRLQQYSVNDAQLDTATGYGVNFMQREPNRQLNPVGAQYHLTDDGYNGEYSRAGRSRKVYRIKNPFQQPEEDKTLQNNNISLDSGTAASNQYGALQYSLPPEEFLQQMRAENQYQQQQQQQHYSTQVPSSPYTATPQPQYQYSTLPASNYDLNQQSNQISTVEPKAFSPGYQSNTFQYNNQNSYNVDNTHSTPTPPYMSTPLPSNQYLGTPANTYVSSSVPMYVSSPQSSQQYVSSPYSNNYSGTLDYNNNNRVTTAGSNSLSYETSNDVSKRMQIDHYDNAANGMQYPAMHSQYQNDFPSSTVSPTSSPYTESSRDLWHSSLNGGYSASKPEQSFSHSQYENYRYNQQDGRYDIDSSNSDTHRIGSIPSANNLYLNFVQPDYQFLNSLKGRNGDSKIESSQSDLYSHGDYGWKLSDKKSSLEPEISTNPNYFKYQIHSVQPDSGAVSQVSFQMDSRKPYNFDQTKPVTEKIEAEEFTKAAAKAHENYKQQLEASKYLSSSQYNNNIVSNSYGYNPYFNTDKSRNKMYNENSNTPGRMQTESITASPLYYMNSKDSLDNTRKQPFDHDKALKNIVPIDVSNVVQNSESQMKFEIDSSNRYLFPGFNKDRTEQNLKPYSRPDPYYKRDTTSSLYSFNLKSKPDDTFNLDKLKQLEQNYFAKPQTAESFYNYGSNSGNKRFVNESPQSINFANQISNNHQDNSQSLANLHQQGIQRPQFSSEINNILKFNDIPYRLTQNLHSNNFEQTNIPSPLPIRINQNVDNHNVDIAAEILSKLLANKQNVHRPEIDSTNNLISNINGFKVANPFNVDLKLVADMLKGKPAIDDSQMASLRGEINKPLKYDMSQLQQLFQLKNDNNMLTNSGLGAYSDIYNSGRLPYQGVKYSRSEEDTENIPIADSSSNHPIGAVIEEDAINGQDVSDVLDIGEDIISTSGDDERPKSVLSSSHKLGDKHRHLSNSYSGRHSYKRKYPKSEFGEPYPLLKPPPPHSSRYRGTHIKEKNSYRRRLNKPKMLRVYKTEPLFENIAEDTTNIKRSLTVAEEKSDDINNEEST